MAVGVIMQFDGGTLDQYDEVIRRMGLTPGGAVADGGMFHWVSATAGGIRVIDVWESRERFEEFAATQIGPITAEVGVAGPPRTEIVPVHNFFTGNASQAAPAPVGVIVEWDGATLGQYDAAIAHAGMAPGAAGAPGCLFHWVGATASGIRVIDVWESRESFERFAAETIMPATAAAGVGGQPRIEFAAVHSYLTDAGAEGIALARRFFEEFCNGRRAELASELVTADFASHGPHAPPADGPDELVERVRLYQEAVDGHWTVNELIVAGDRVVARWTGTGTHVGELMGVAPTGRPISVDAITIFRIAGGRIAEEWTVWDALGLLQQIGALPEPAAAA